MRRCAALLLACLAFVPSVLAHDFWIEPESFTPKVGAILKVRLRVGDVGRGENVPRSEQRIVRFELVHGATAKSLVGRDGQEVAGLVRLESEGTTLLGYVSNQAFVELDGPKFASYLEEKGLDAIARRRAERGELEQPARELYARSVKSLITVGGRATDGFDRAMNLPLELIPHKNPSSLGRGAEGAGYETLPLSLYFEAQPLAGALVAALCLDEPHADATKPLFARTDERGRVELALPRAGRWLIAAVHMRPAQEHPERADYESYWGSLTFEIPAPTK
ncbi:MAG: DUF4198 domain-containing protein [Planctomycetes bacterium]|nr:DUF4198 domain-containing protein [Planctomycetota bacterium]